MNVEKFTKELFRCWKKFMNHESFQYKGPKFKTNEILATCFPIEQAITDKHVQNQIERGTPALMQFFLAAYQMGYDTAADKDKDVKSLLTAINKKLPVPDADAIKRSKGKSPKLPPPLKMARDQTVQKLKFKPKK